jgi:alpha-L-rhamnosidase
MVPQEAPMTAIKWLGWILLSALMGAAALASKTGSVAPLQADSITGPAARHRAADLVVGPDGLDGAHASPAQTGESQHGRRENVEVFDLRVNGRYDEPIGLGDPSPVLAWRMRAKRHGSHRCERSGPEVACPADRQTAYQIQAAESRHDLLRHDLVWDSGKVASSAQAGIPYAGDELRSRKQVVWRVRVWDAEGAPSEWSSPSRWEMGLLQQSDWGRARWIEYPGRTESQPLPIFARQFNVSCDVARARLYLSGIGLHLATVNGQELTDEVLAPGNSNYQLSSEYRTYDVTDKLERGQNTVGVRLGNGTAYVRRSVVNPAVGRTSPYSWWQSQLKGSGSLVAAASAGATSVQLTSTSDYHVGGTINIDTGNGGDALESRTITAIGTGGAGGSGISFTPALERSHIAGALVTGSGNNIAATDPSAGAAVTPRMIARLEITYEDGTQEVIVSDRRWRTALGAYTTDAWYSGSDYDARREPVGWDQEDADLSGTARRRDGSEVGWIDAGIAPPPNLATKLVARDAPPVRIAEELTPISVSNPAPGTYVFDFGQNFVGWPQLNLEAPVPAGTAVRMSPAESLASDGSGVVDQSSLGPGGRGRDLFNTYTAAGDGPEVWQPDFQYFGMQWVQVTGLPPGYPVSTDLLTGLRLQADTPFAGSITTSNERINRIHKMVRYSFAGNIMSVFTDCPGREKLSYPADYTMVMGAIERNHELAAYMRTTAHHLVEGQSTADTPMRGNVALKTPVYDWGYTGRFGDEINWGGAIVLVPAMLYELYGDTDTMVAYYDEMVDFADYIAREKAGTGADEHIVDAALADWVSADTTSGRITGTWGYFLVISKLAMMADVTGHAADAAHYAELADAIKAAFNEHFYNQEQKLYATDGGSGGTTEATQTAQALALDAGLVPEEDRGAVLDQLVDLIETFNPSGDGGPHFAGGTIGLSPIVRALVDGGRDDVLWNVLQEDAYPSYGHFMESTPANPNGFTTVGERWTRGSSKNHMILAQIEEWFHEGLAGIRQADGSLQYREIVIKPRLVGDLTSAKGSYRSPQGLIRSEWIKRNHRFDMKVEVPANTSAEIWVPRVFAREAPAPRRARFLRAEDGYAVYQVGSGVYTFASAGPARED